MKIFSMTDVGRKREMNQDYVFATDESLGTLPNLLVVADGMGGHKAGDFASKYTVEVLKEELKHTLKDGPEEILKDAYIAHTRIIKALKSKKLDDCINAVVEHIDVTQEHTVKVAKEYR
jgi:serine/threonine protein phosphatase PrpC